MLSEVPHKIKYMPKIAKKSTWWSFVTCNKKNLFQQPKQTKSE